MKILTSLNYKYKDILNDIFLPSLPKDIDLKIEYMNYDLDGRWGSFDTLYKFPQIMNVLSVMPMGQYMFYCDVDSVFLDDNFIDNIEKMIEKNPKDIYVAFAHTHHKLCVGVLLIKNTDNIIRLFCEFLQKDVDWIIQHHGVSQTYFYELLNELKINWDYLPEQFWSDADSRTNPEKLWHYHAAGVPQDINLKYQKLKSYL